MTRLLVTGGAGFIGSRIVAAAHASGWDVRIIDALRSDVHAGEPLLPDGVELIRGDITDPRSLDEAFREVDVVSHQAAKVGMGVDVSDAPDYATTNVVGTAEVLAAMRRADIGRLVLASSMVVYGEGAYRGPDGPRRPAARSLEDLRAGMFEPRGAVENADEPTGDILTPTLTLEDAPLDPRSLYAASKLAQEHFVGVWAAETGGRAAMLRYHNVYGPGMPRDTPYAGVAAIFRSALARGEAPRVFEDGAQRRDFIHVDDIAAANLAATEWTAEQTPGTARAFNVGSGTVSTILDVARALCVGSELEPLVTGEFRSGDVRHITASSERARTELGWSARVALADGMREFATAPLRS